MNYNIFYNVYEYIQQSKKLEYLLAVFDGENFKYVFENWYMRDENKIIDEWTSFEPYKCDYLVIQHSSSESAYYIYDKLREEIETETDCDLLFIKYDPHYLVEDDEDTSFRCSEDKKEIVDTLIKVLEDINDILVFEINSHYRVFQIIEILHYMYNNYKLYSFICVENICNTNCKEFIYNGEKKLIRRLTLC